MTKQGRKPFTSRRILDLEQQISRTRDIRERLVLHARRAALLAHSSEIEVAKELVADLRRVNKAFEARLSAWIMFCEAVIYHSDSYDTKGAYERLRRAYLFAGAAKDRELAASCASWLASCHFEMGEKAGITKYIDEAFEWGLPDHFGPMSRAAMVLADSLTWVGEHDLARSWHLEAKHYAAMEGDIMMQNAVIYNMAAFGVTRSWLELLSGSVDLEQLSRARMEVDSSETLNALLSNTSNERLVPLLRAELLTVAAEWPAALQEFEKFFVNSDQSNLSRYLTKLRAEQALCFAKTGESERSLWACDESMRRIEDCSDLDDLAVTHHCLAEAIAICNQPDRAEYHRESSRIYLGGFRDQQASISGEMKALADKLRIHMRTKKDPASPGPSSQD